MLAGAPDYAYNEYLQIWIELGLPGVLSCLCLMAYVYIRLLRCRNVEVVGLCGAMVSFMVVSFFLILFDILPHAYYLCLFYYGLRGCQWCLMKRKGMERLDWCVTCWF